MDTEAPADAWMVWIGLSLVTATLAGVVVAVPSTQVPDAPGAANVIDEVASSSRSASATYTHNARMYWVKPHSIGLKNAAGRRVASTAFGRLCPVVGNADLKAVLAGADVRDRFASKDDFEAAIEAQIRAIDREDPTWYPASGTLRVRRVTWGDVHVTLVEF